ncbi:MAG TPA: hypothetical protein VH834_23595 [Solirubrobacteraceae bacterium]
MSVVREEFGPTLPELLGSRFGVPARKLWLALAALGVVALAVVLWLALRPTPGQADVVVRTPVAFNLAHTDALRRAAPRAGEMLRLESTAGPPQSFVVHPLRIGSYKGDVSAELTLMSSRMIDEMRAHYPGFIYRSDGRVNINKQPGYQIVFQAKVDGRTTYGKRVLLVAGPDPPPHSGLDITMLAARSAGVPKADAVAANGALKTPYRSLRFGTQRP